MESPSPEYADYHHRPSNWPMVCGILAITFGLLGGGVQLLKILQASGMMMMPMGEIDIPATGDAEQDQMMDDMVAQQAEMMKSMADAAPMMLGSGVVLFLLAVLLFVGGVMLCCRKKMASPLLKVWAVLKIFAGGFGAWIALRMTNGMFSSYGDILDSAMASSAGGAGVPDVGQMMNVAANVFFVLNLLWIAALPVFFLIWFNREIVKEELSTAPWWR